MKNFKELKVWQKGIELVAIVYKITSSFPEEEKYGLIAQMRRAAVSIPSNIAEGHLRKTAKDFKQFLSIARGSCAELETQIIIAHELDFIHGDNFENLSSKIEELSKMLSSFYSKINPKPPTR
ncbi:MAG: four helix bundle protein [Methanophagales archaeon]|nr:four helix bundle protein [Methanophagales archaeon]